uniref:Uncharacterized protein n=1 Tax=Terrapene triunguis TaxID=2587831 RepID=A0A674JEJ1_9SAUR
MLLEKDVALGKEGEQQPEQKPAVTETHQLAEANEKKNERLRAAFGISENYVDGSSFDPNRRAKEAAAAAAKQQEQQKQYRYWRGWGSAAPCWGGSGLWGGMAPPPAGADRGCGAGGTAPPPAGVDRGCGGHRLCAVLGWVAHIPPCLARGATLPSRGGNANNGAQAPGLLPRHQGLSWG